MTSPGTAATTRRTPIIVPDDALSTEPPPSVVPGAGPEPPEEPSEPPLQSDEPAQPETEDRRSPDGLRSRLLTLSEAAAVFRRRPRTIRGWVQAGRLSLVRIGAAKFVSTDHIERILGRSDAD